MTGSADEPGPAPARIASLILPATRKRLLRARPPTPNCRGVNSAEAETAPAPPDPQVALVRFAPAKAWPERLEYREALRAGLPGCSVPGPAPASARARRWF